MAKEPAISADALFAETLPMEAMAKRRQSIV
jgi:hypothetical protein